MIKKRACYVDNFGKVSQVTIRSLAGGAKYVSKYITKDMSFFMTCPMLQDIYLAIKIVIKIFSQSIGKVMV